MWCSSIIYGKTIDNVKSLKTILSNGEDHDFKIRFSEFEKLILNDSFTSKLYLNSINLFKEYTDELAIRYPDIQRRVGGYNLDEINKGGYVDLTKIIVGSEGTLFTVTEAELNLVELPKSKGLLVIEFDDIKSMEASVIALDFKPSAVEHIGEIIISEAKAPEFSSGIEYLNNNPTDIIVVEFYGENNSEVQDKISKLQEK